jgi:DNA-binding LacI/PurR family transcriptional regulator
VLNDTPHHKISSSTRKRVLDAAAQLGYSPLAAARALASGRSSVVLCLLHDVPMGRHMGLILSETTRILAECGLTLVTHHWSETATRPIYDIWRTITPAAVISFAKVSDEDLAAMRQAGTEVIVALRSGRRRKHHDLELSEEPVGRLQVRHLVERGHRRLGYASPDDPRLQLYAAPRLDGARRECEALGLPPPVVRTASLDPARAAETLRTWLKGDEPITAIAAYNDEVALALLAGMRLLGLQAPADLAIIGCDDNFSARLAVPPLTTIALDLHADAQHVAQTILGAVAGKRKPRKPYSRALTVIERETT